MICDVHHLSTYLLTISFALGQSPKGCWSLSPGLGDGSAAGHSRGPATVCYWVSQVALVVKNPPANAGDVRDTGLIPGSGRSPGGGHGNPLQYSCLENPMDRGAYQATVHSIA